MTSMSPNSFVSTLRRFREKEQIPVNNKATNIEQWRLYRAETDPVKKQKMANQLFFANYFLIASPFARRFHQGHNEVAGRAYLFFLMIVDNYDPERDVSFSTYVRYWHRHQHQADDASTQRHDIRLTTNMVAFMQSVAKYRGIFIRKNLRPPTTHELYELIKIEFPNLLLSTPSSKKSLSIEEFEQKILRASYSLVSLDAPVSLNGESSFLHESIPQHQSANSELFATSLELFRKVKDAEAKLYQGLTKGIHARDREILCRRIEQGHTLEEIGRDLHLTRERVRQLVKRNCYKHFIVRHKLTPVNFLRLYDFLYHAADPLGEPSLRRWEYLRMASTTGIKPVEVQKAHEIENILALIHPSTV